MIGISSGDFTAIFNEMRRAVTYQTVTKTSTNITGSDDKTYSSASENLIFLKRAQRSIWTDEGLLDLGDAYIIVLPSTAINRGDRVTVDGETFEVTPDSQIIIRKVAGTSLYKYATVYKIQGGDQS